MTKQQMKVIAQAEHEMFCLRDLLEGSVPAKVMNRAYEYVIKQDLLSVLRETPLTHQQLSVLMPQRRPLDFLYRLWLKTEYSHIDALRRAVRRETRRIYLKRQTEAFHFYEQGCAVGRRAMLLHHVREICSLCFLSQFIL